MSELLVAVKRDQQKPGYHLIDLAFDEDVITRRGWNPEGSPESYLLGWTKESRKEPLLIRLAFHSVVKMFNTDNPQHVARIELARGLAHGAEKYATHNWRKGFVWSRLWRPAYGHIQSHRSGNIYDDETGFMHLSHALCALMFLYVHQRDGLGTDDRAEMWP